MKRVPIIRERMLYHSLCQVWLGKEGYGEITTYAAYRKRCGCAYVLACGHGDAGGGWDHRYYVSRCAQHPGVPEHPNIRQDNALLTLWIPWHGEPGGEPIEL